MVYFNRRSRKEGRSRNYDREGWLRIQTFAIERPKKPKKTRGFLQNPRVIHVFLFAALPADPATPTLALGRPKNPKKLEVSYRTQRLSIFLFAALPADPAAPTLAPGSCGGECSCHSSLPSTTTASAGWTVLLGVGLALGLIAALVGLVAFYLKRK
jgi:hypothetical protein